MTLVLRWQVMLHEEDEDGNVKNAALAYAYAETPDEALRLLAEQVEQKREAAAASFASLAEVIGRVKELRR